jgi:pimeloyl-[acyl-carrier protein] methyl ester esterase
MPLPALALETRGRGPDLVLLHGWGSNLAVWAPLVARLIDRFRVHAVDLPGYGASPPVFPYTPEEIAGVLAARFPPSVAVCGWSLGGMVALALARRAPFARMVLIGATPCFARAPDWEDGMDAGMLRQFHDDLVADFDATLGRFIALQSLGDSDARTTARALTEALHARGRPAPEVLEAGLAILAETDLRAAVPLIGVPALLIHGERDRLVPPGAARWLAQNLVNARLQTVAGAGHAPFLSHPDAVASAMAEFLVS